MRIGSWLRSAGGRDRSRAPWDESLTSRLERSQALDPLGRTLTRAFTKVVRHGVVKDALSGTWMGHPAHPMLTDVTIGAWISAGLLDVVGGERG
ncbi:MAG: hypothetical protein M3N52_05900, partial [Actinomycetota bacterium]|nr:hypothetical protein [Actinomycetota bacterium]